MGNIGALTKIFLPLVMSWSNTPLIRLQLLLKIKMCSFGILPPWGHSQLSHLGSILVIVAALIGHLAWFGHPRFPLSPSFLPGGF